VTSKNSSTRLPLSKFNALWLAESVRLTEQDSPANLPRPKELERLGNSPTKQEKQHWLLLRAYLCGRHNGLLGLMQSWATHARVVFGVFALLALISGISATLGIFGADERHVNVLWTLIGLIGVHFIALLVWCLSALIRSPLSSGLLGKLWFGLAQYWGRASESADIRQQSVLRSALTQLLSSSGIGLWRLRVASHSLWLIVLMASLVTLLLVLSIRNYAFVLETTIVAPQTFVSLVQYLSIVPAQFGFVVPDENMIATALNGAEQVQDEASRRAWASFLCGMLLVYAILPRFLFWLYARLRLAQLGSQLEMNLNARGYSDLILAELGQSKTSIKDSAPALRGPSKMAPQFLLSGTGALVFGIELESSGAWPLKQASSENLRAIEGIESGQQRVDAITKLKAAPAERVLIVCNASLSPDRGTLRWIVEISHFSEQLRVLLLAEPGNNSRARTAVWCESLLSIGLESDRVFADDALALSWVNSHE
jgi:hypothetical protein